MYYVRYQIKDILLHLLMFLTMKINNLIRKPVVALSLALPDLCNYFAAYGYIGPGDARYLHSDSTQSFTVFDRNMADSRMGIHPICFGFQNGELAVLRACDRHGCDYGDMYHNKYCCQK